LSKELRREGLGLSKRGNDYFNEYVQNIREGMDYYVTLSEELFQRSRGEIEAYFSGIRSKLDSLLSQASPA
jgi:hypothetical protein